MIKRDFMVSVERYDVQAFLDWWQWLFPPTHTALFISVLGDWVFGAPDGSLWMLSTLDGSYRKIAEDANEYNRNKKSFDWIDDVFYAGWQEIGLRHGFDPSIDQCLTWKISPILGGKFEVANMEVRPMTVHQCLMGQLHDQLRFNPRPTEFILAEK